MRDFQTMKSWLQRQLAIAGYYLSRDSDDRKDFARIEKQIARLWDKIDDVIGPIQALVELETLQLQLALDMERHRVLSETAFKTPDNVVLKGRKVFSQGDEDGIIDAVFAILGGQKTFIEIGCGDGLENNTRLLLMNGWRGVWVDGSEEHIAAIDASLGGLSFRQLFIERRFLDSENIGQLVTNYCEFLGQREVDFFSLDIDGNDLHVLLRALEVFNPRVLCVEYNAKFPPPLAVVTAYDAKREWAYDDYQGCSLMAWVDALASRYTLLTCTLSGVNALFVRKDLAQRFKIYRPEDLYQPARYHRIRQVVGHPSSSNWLRDVLAKG
jgi:hypothetical protein